MYRIFIFIKKKKSFELLKTRLLVNTFHDNTHNIEYETICRQFILNVHLPTDCLNELIKYSVVNIFLVAVCN